MGDRLEAATSGRARCRACGGAIAKGSVRFGEELPGAYGEGDAASVFWFHPRCAADRRSEKLLPLLPADGDLAALRPAAELGVAHPRLTRIEGAERAPSGRARCRHCQEPITAGGWRLRLSAFGDNGFFEPLGFIHAGCAGAYAGLGDLEERVTRTTPELDPASLAELRAALESG